MYNKNVQYWKHALPYNKRVMLKIYKVKKINTFRTYVFKKNICRETFVQYSTFTMLHLTTTKSVKKDNTIRLHRDNEFLIKLKNFNHW